MHTLKSLEIEVCNTEHSDKLQVCLIYEKATGVETSLKGKSDIKQKRKNNGENWCLCQC